ncbi:flavodoxin family protein [Agitococcus lubricus]|uniref:NADPH-dependent FMN reductase n=1 Tax=Agitococcus lubricus TaxID=1077255 RepID=A0A2T5IWY3_9GAMM|nr:NAD(P)H-dependent oxidoreductase [Agitococcus lubricus]PTQ88439.1 NADPH-dependent FMN reductase [Agitococcus lubricus]
MKQLLIVGHTPSANTEQLREALVQGSQHPDIVDVACVYKSALDASAEDVLACDGIILFTTENLGYMSGALKDFFDRCYYPVLEKKQGLACAILIRAGHDGTGTQRALNTILTGLRWKIVHDIVILRGQWQSSFVAEAEELGLHMAAGLEVGIW